MARPRVVAAANRWRGRHAVTFAGLALSLGIGWLIGANTFEDRGAASSKLALGLGRIDQRVETLAKQIPATSRSAEIVALQSSVENLKLALDITRIRTADAVSQVKAKIDAVQHGPAAQIPTMLLRLDQIEQRQVERQKVELPAEPAPLLLAPSAPEAQRAAPVSLVKPALLPASLRAAIPPGGYVLRQVEDGIAFIESREGLRSVEPGQVLPRAGKVRAIEKRGGKWVVVTSGGVIDGDLY